MIQIDLETLTLHPMASEEPLELDTEGDFKPLLILYSPTHAYSLHPDGWHAWRYVGAISDGEDGYTLESAPGHKGPID